MFSEVTGCRDSEYIVVSADYLAYQASLAGSFTGTNGTTEAHQLL